MPETVVEKRVGEDEESIRREASRCLQCDDPTCIEACPLRLNIKRYVLEAGEGRFRAGLETILKQLPFPATCGRVCPHPCEDACILYDSIPIRKIKKFLADQFMDIDWYPGVEARREEKIAVVGSGPAGLTAARNLRLQGYQVTVFDSSPSSGGMLAQSIPDYRLPTQFPRKEVEEINKLGVKFEQGTLGKDLSLDSFFNEGFKAILIGIGTHGGMKMNIPGEDLKGIFEALDLLKNIKLNKSLPSFEGKRVIVVGGGNVAMDAARSCHRLGADVTLVYRRSWNEMPADRDEIEGAKEEGVNFNILTNPTRILGKGRVTEVELIRMELGAPDDSGRRRPVPIKGSEFTIPADFVIEAVGEVAESDALRQTGLELSPGGLIKVNDNMMTSIEGVFAAGDVVSGPRTIIEAVAGGAKAAESIGVYLRQAKAAAVARVAPAIPAMERSARGKGTD